MIGSLARCWSSSRRGVNPALVRGRSRLGAPGPLGRLPVPDSGGDPGDSCGWRLAGIGKPGWPDTGQAYEREGDRHQILERLAELAATALPDGRDELFRMLGDPTRRRILDLAIRGLLVDGPGAASNSLRRGRAATLKRSPHHIHPRSRAAAGYRARFRARWPESRSVWNRPAAYWRSDMEARARRRLTAAGESSTRAAPVMRAPTAMERPFFPMARNRSLSVVSSPMATG